jgi:hypothetical protein
MSHDLIDRTLVLLHQVEQHTRSPEELEALKTAKLALHFILERGEQQGLEDYLKHFDSARDPVPLLAFAARDEADTWLKTHPAPPHGALVSVAGGLYSVGFNRKSGLRILVRLPTHEELGSQQGSEEP